VTTWAVLLAWLTSVAFGVVSAIIPVVNAELYVLVSQVSAVAGVVPVAVGVGVGQTIGKCLLFTGVRRGRQFRFVREHRQRSRTQPRGRVRQTAHDVLQALLRLVGTPRWGLPITLLAAVVGIPPLYAVALLAGATTMKLRSFALVVLVGRVTRFLLVAYGVTMLPFLP
jgi:membrane protein YqaA with SNARE-associated domain